MNVTGRCEILLNGQMMLHKTGAVAGGIGISGEAPFERKAIRGESGHHGYTEEPIPAYLEVTVTDREDISLDQIARIKDNGTIIVRASKGGKVYTMQNATCTGNITVTTGEGETKLRFEGPYWTEGKEAS